MILLTGATGYVGGRLLPLLEQQGYRVRALARRPEVLVERAAPSTEVVAGDVLDRSSLDAAMRGVETAYYLVHSMGSSGSFEEADRTAAANFGGAARAAGVRRIIYLGGLGSDEEELSPHLRSRQEVGRILRDSGVPVVEFRASVVIGSGSLSFEMIRALVDRLPFMITPRWVNVMAQPIAIDDLLEYLLAALTLPDSPSSIHEIGGADRVCYADIMREYARPHPTRLRVGDTVDFWRVEAIQPDRLLRLRAEMRLPGRAWLEFEVTADGDTSTIRQTATFDPARWYGRAYWFALLPLHELVFAGMLRGIARAVAAPTVAR